MNVVKDRPVTAHVFEYTTSFALDPDLHFKYPDKGIVPCQIIFCMKEKNVRPLRESHLTLVGQEDQLAPMVLQRLCTAAIGKSDSTTLLLIFPVAKYLRPVGRRYKASPEIAILPMEDIRSELECRGSRRGDCRFQRKGVEESLESFG